MRRLLAAAALALALPAAAAAAGLPTKAPDTLTVGVAMPSEGFEVGVVAGSKVLLAQGLEIDLARALAAQLGLKRAVFQQNRFDLLYARGAKPWDVALAEITVTPARARNVDFSVPYMHVDQGVMLAQTVTKAPTTIAGLRALKLCALSKSTGADAARDIVKPEQPVRLIGNVPTLLLNVQTGTCQAIVYDAPALGTLKARAPDRYGSIAGVLRTAEAYGVALPKGSPLLSRVNAAIGRLTEDGTLDRFERRWLTVDLSKLPVLR